MANYYLMHRNDICGKFTYDEISGRISSYHDMENGLSPFLGNSNLKKYRNGGKCARFLPHALPYRKSYGMQTVLHPAVI